MTRITLVRHGQTDWNLERRMQGSKDIALNDTGRRQAREAAPTIVPEGPVLLVSSDLSRAVETAQLLAEHHGWNAPLQYAGLRERAFGDAEGTRVDEFVATFGPWKTAVVPNAETLEAVRERALTTLREIDALARTMHAPLQAHIVAVSHGVTIRELLRAVSEPEAEDRPITNLSAHTILFERDRMRALDAS